MNTYQIYINGSSVNGKGGWVSIVKKGKQEQILKGFESNTTACKMELVALVRALESINDSTCAIKIYSNSEYIVKGTNKWIHKWRKGKFLNIKHPELWISINKYLQQFKIEMIYFNDYAVNFHLNSLSKLEAYKVK